MLVKRKHKSDLVRQIVLSLCHQGESGSTAKPAVCSYWLTSGHPRVPRISASQLDLHRQVAVPAAAKPDVAGCRVKHIQVQKMQAAALSASKNRFSHSRVALFHKKAPCSCDAHLRVV